MGTQFTVSLVPLTCLPAPEMQSISETPILLEIVLSIRLDTTRVAAVTRGVRDPNKEVGQSNHLGVF